MRLSPPTALRGCDRWIRRIFKMSHATLIVCAAVVIWSAGCAPTYEQRHAAIQAEYDQEMAKIHAKYDAMARKNQQESADCIRHLTSLAIGSSALELKGVYCKPSKINTTKTGTATLDQWVYEFPDNQTVYMYYRNGNLTAVQY